MLGSNDKGDAHDACRLRTESETIGLMTASSFACVPSAIAKRDKVMARIAFVNQ
jgi:hypothetical protein